MLGWLSLEAMRASSTKAHGEVVGGGVTCVEALDGYRAPEAARTVEAPEVDRRHPAATDDAVGGGLDLLPGHGEG